mgnify:CR=1 FL=1
MLGGQRWRWRAKHARMAEVQRATPIYASESVCRAYASIHAGKCIYALCAQSSRILHGFENQFLMLCVTDL